MQCAGFGSERPGNAPGFCEVGFGFFCRRRLVVAGKTRCFKPGKGTGWYRGDRHVCVDDGVLQLKPVDQERLPGKQFEGFGLRRIRIRHRRGWGGLLRLGCDERCVQFGDLCLGFCLIGLGLSKGPGRLLKLLLQQSDPGSVCLQEMKLLFELLDFGLILCERCVRRFG